MNNLITVFFKQIQDGRLQRLPYFFYSLLLFCLFVFGLFLIVFVISGAEFFLQGFAFDGDLQKTQDSLRQLFTTPFLLIMGVFVFAWLFAIVNITAKRIRDIGCHGWLGVGVLIALSIIASIITFYGTVLALEIILQLALLFMPSNFINLYKKMSKARKINISVSNVAVWLLLIGLIYPQNKLEIIDISSDWQNVAEIDRLRWFKEINALSVLKEQKLTGKGVMITIMGEMVDAAHPDLKDRVKQQYNTWLHKGRVLNGEGNQIVSKTKFEPGDGHGTHIAGTIGATCDGFGVQGLACDASLQIYDLGAYESAKNYSTEGWGDIDEFERFIVAFTDAVRDVTKKRSSKILTGSFNLESPAIHYDPTSKLKGTSITELVNTILNEADGIDDIVDQKLAIFKDLTDIKFLKKTIASNENDSSIAALSLIPLTQQWDDLVDAIADYQRTDGVYLFTESNYVFEGRTSTLNALPHLSGKIDMDLWLSVVMVQPKEKSKFSKETLEDNLEQFLSEKTYTLPINSCGEMASDYCILTPSWEVFSTMTERLFSKNEGSLYKMDDRFYTVFEGHSMGAPMVAATLALMEEKNQKEKLNYSMKELVAILKKSANRSFPGYDPKLHGRGLLDVGAAVGAMVSW